MLKAATDFLVAYLRKGEDGKYHIIPTVSPENWGLTADYRLNRDCIIDLALTEFLLEAMLPASEILNRDAGERPRWREILDHTAPYPEGEGPYERVSLNVRDAPMSMCTTSRWRTPRSSAKRARKRVSKPRGPAPRCAPGRVLWPFAGTAAFCVSPPLRERATSSSGGDGGGAEHANSGGHIIGEV